MEQLEIFRKSKEYNQVRPSTHGGSRRKRVDKTVEKKVTFGYSNNETV